MFALSLFIGIYSYGIFALGILGILTKTNITAFTFSWLLIFLFYFIFNIRKLFKIKNLKLKINEVFVLGLLITQSLINLLGTLGPEYGFDALWYHLTLPKIWLSEHIIRYLPGAVFKYSVMPKLTETLYTAALAFGNETTAKLIHYIFGLLILVPLYQLSRKFFNRVFSLLVLLIFYTNLVVGWQSITAYVDLSRTFFEILALKLFFDEKYTRSAITLGLAISVKLISLGSLPIFIILLLFRKKSLLFAARYALFAILIPLPWFISSFINTGNPIYPFLSSVYPPADFSFNPKDIWILFTQNPDPVSPIYIITAPLIFFSSFKKWSRGVVAIFLYTGLSLLFWFITPRTGGGRFILPYLPAFSLCSVILIESVKDIFLKKFLIFLTLTFTLTSLFYRFLANIKYLPVISGVETKEHFLINHLNFSWGDYYDTDNFLARTLKPGDNLLVSGINNLFYLPSQIRFSHISTLPKEFSLTEFNYFLTRYPSSGFHPGNEWKIVHLDAVSHTALYQKY